MPDEAGAECGEKAARQREEMGQPMESSDSLGTRDYYVDEAGDATLFRRDGHLTIGKGGCSRFFILGLLDVARPGELACDLADLRRQLLADPYFHGVPSMHPNGVKTALAFHAKDDLPEVRRLVFALLQRHELRFLAAVRDKQSVLEYVRHRNEREPAYRYNPNELYDFMVRSLFKNSLHKADEYRVHFARRGKSDRSEALMAALESARERFNLKWSLDSQARLRVHACDPARCAPLQAVDYFLWALQRFFERGEVRYITYLWPQVGVVHDMDDKRVQRYGVYYTKRKPLTAALWRGAGDIGSTQS
ncbi:MAG TPA: DUF3800 domain-containing protein [Anaerolineae bacterium]|nr:DUF3800 domain-containing protein [Anaerolineae bacterium]